MLNQPILQITLPLMVTFVTVIWAANWSQNKRYDDLQKYLDVRFKSLEDRLDKIEKRLDRLEEPRMIK